MFNTFSQQGVLFQNLPEGIRARMEYTGKLVPRMLTFSDSVLVYVPLHNDHFHIEPIVALWSVLLAVAGLFPYLLGNGIVARGGIEVGMLLTLDDDDVYGPAIERAYHLESEVAQYPRVCVGDELLNYLTEVEQQPMHHPSAMAAASVARSCRSLIASDTDGMPVIDYLGAGAREFGGTDEVQLVVHLAYQWVVRRTQQLRRGPDKRLANRYGALLTYFDRHISKWPAPKDAPATESRSDTPMDE
jgi:hypothetical protein